MTEQSTNTSTKMSRGTDNPNPRPYQSPTALEYAVTQFKLQIHTSNAFLSQLSVGNIYSDQCNQDDHQHRTLTALACLSFGIRLHLCQCCLIQLEGTDKILFQLLSGLLRMSNVLKEFIRILPCNIQHNFRTTGMIIQVFSHIIHLGSTYLPKTNGVTNVRI